MSSIFGGGNPKVIPEFTGLQVNTAVQVLPVPIIYGGPRTDMNLIYYNGFNSQIVKQQSGKGTLSGGKGGPGQVEYFASIILAFGEGPIGPPLVIYQDQEVWTPSTYPTNGSEFFEGTPTQEPWSYVTTNWPSDARGYKDTAYYAFNNAQLDSSGTVPQINVVIAGIASYTCPLNNSTLTISSGQYDQSGNPLSFLGNITLGNIDADPGIVILDFLTNGTYGAGFPIEWIDQSTLLTQAGGWLPDIGDKSLSTFCQAVGLGWSVVVNNVESASNIIDRWTKNLNTAVVWNGALLRFIPYWDQYNGDNPNYFSGNPLGIGMKYYNPYIVPICAVSLDQIVQSDDKESDPISYARKDPWEVYNTVRLDFMDRTNFFNSNPVEAKDESLIELYGPRVDNIGSGDEFSLQTYANISVQMQLRRNVAIRLTYTWKMGPLWGWLDPMDIVSIPDPANFANSVIVRITAVEDDDDENITVTAEAYPIGAQSPSIIPMSPTTPPNQGAVNGAPGNIDAPIIFAPTTAMLAAQGFGTVAQALMGFTASNGDGFNTNWGGGNIWISVDNVSYEMLGTLKGPSTFGSLQQAASAYGGSNPDLTGVITVNLNQSDGVLASVSSTAAANGASICVLQDGSGFEIFSYTTATLVGSFTYALTGLYRGLYGTTSRFWGAGSAFMAVGTGSNFFETPLPAQYVGTDFWIKVTSFNVFNNATEELADATAWRYTATSPTPVPPTPPIAMSQPPARQRLRKGVATNVLRKPKSTV